MESRRFARSRNAWLFGVCGGLAEYTGINATLMRAVWVLLAIMPWFGGLAVVAYVVLAFVMGSPEGAPSGERFWHNLQGQKMMKVAAVVLICWGGSIIVQELLHFDIQRYVFPVGLVVAGVLLMVFAFGGRRGTP